MLCLKKKKKCTVVGLIPCAVNMPKFGNNSVCVENFLVQIYKSSLESKQITCMQVLK